jgi:hypothetical protein
MRKIVLRVRPKEVMEELNLDLIRERSSLMDIEMEVQDTRLSDAPYISVVAKIPTINEEVLARLKGAFRDMPRMQVNLWIRIGKEVALDTVDTAVLEKAASSLSQIKGGR